MCDKCHGVLEGHRKIGKLIILIHKTRKTGVNAPSTGLYLCLASQEECMPSSLKKDKAIQLNQSWLIPSADFVAVVALQNKFPLSRNFREILGACQRCIHMFCRPRESVWPGSLWKALGCCGSTVLMDASCWPSNTCIPAQKIVSVSTELNHNRSALVLDSNNGVCCHYFSSQFTSGFF